MNKNFILYRYNGKFYMYNILEDYLYRVTKHISYFDGKYKGISLELSWYKLDHNFIQFGEYSTVQDALSRCEDYLYLKIN